MDRPTECGDLIDLHYSLKERKSSKNGRQLGIMFKNWHFLIIVSFCFQHCSYSYLISSLFMTKLVQYFDYAVSVICIATHSFQFSSCKISDSYVAFLCSVLYINIAVLLQLVKKLLKASKAYPEWKEQNSPNWKPWHNPEQMTAPRITIQDVSVGQIHVTYTASSSCVVT